MASQCAPIAVFAFRRPTHLQMCLDALSANVEARDSALWIFCDGPRHDADISLVEEVRKVANSAIGFASVRVIGQSRNVGLSSSVISGVSQVLSLEERLIVVEDDLVVSPDFLGFMNEGLDLYADSSDVVSIHGFTYAVSTPLPQSFFLRGADCWGWATWRRGWEIFNHDGKALLHELDETGLSSVFDFDDAYPYRKMLVDQIEGRIDSWAILWNASAFLAGKLTLYPGVSLVENIGQDGSGTHSSWSRSHSSKFRRMSLPLAPVPIVESIQARAAISKVLAQNHGQSTIARILRRLYFR